jgi:hypothetical protein
MDQLAQSVVSNVSAEALAEKRQRPRAAAAPRGDVPAAQKRAV